MPDDSPPQLPPRGPPIAFRADGLWQRSLFNTLGRGLLSRSMKRLAEAPQELSAEQRAGLQRSVGRTLLEHLQVRLEIDGLQNLPDVSQGAHIVVSLHEGLVDPLCLTQLPLALRFVARQEIFEWPMIGAAIARMRHIAIEPEQGASSYRKLLRAARAVLNGGEHLLMFAQGCILGIEIAFQPGAFHLARAMNAPILPVVITGSHRIWEHPFAPTLRYRQRVTVQVLAAIAAHEIACFGCERVRADLSRRMKAIALSSTSAPPRRYVPERDGLWEAFAFTLDPDFVVPTRV